MTFDSRNNSGCLRSFYAAWELPTISLDIRGFSGSSPSPPLIYSVSSVSLPSTCIVTTFVETRALLCVRLRAPRLSVSLAPLAWFGLANVRGPTFNLLSSRFLNLSGYTRVAACLVPGLTTSLVLPLPLHQLCGFFCHAPLRSFARSCTLSFLAAAEKLRSYTRPRRFLSACLGYFAPVSVPDIPQLPPGGRHLSRNLETSVMSSSCVCIDSCCWCLSFPLRQQHQPTDDRSKALSTQTPPRRSRSQQAIK